MNAPDFDPTGGQRRWAGLALVVGLHVLIGWALASGLARKAIEIVKKPIEMRIIDELKPPPPPPPPPPPAPPEPKVAKIKEVAKPPAPPPPPFVPPPEVRVATPPPPAPVIQVTQPEPPRQPVEIKPAPPPAPPAPPAPPPPAPARTERAEAGVVCPGYRDILQTALAGAYDRVGVEGVVKTQFVVRSGKIADVTALSGPREYHRLVQNAVRRFNCRSETGEDVQVSIEVVFREQ